MNSPLIGIDDLSIYIPKLYLPLAELAIQRDIEYGKLNKGLGLTHMAIPDCNEDAASMAANAVLDLVKKNDLKPGDLGRIYLGTESALDGAKPTATYILDMIQAYYEPTYGPNSLEHCDVLDMTFACIGAIDAMLTTVDWVKANPKRIGIVVSSDVAKYDLRSTGEYTQGAGSIAMLIKASPRLLSISDEVGVSTGPAHDFFKPKRTIKKQDFANLYSDSLGICKEKIIELLNTLEPDDSNLTLHKDTPVFDGPFSNDCYKSRVESALNQFNTLSKTDIYNRKSDNWERYIYHLPYAFHAKRISTDIAKAYFQAKGQWIQIINELGLEESDEGFTKAFAKSAQYRSFVQEKIEKSQRISGLIGNMYSCSIFLALISTLHFDCKENVDLDGKTIGFLAYGSGAKSKVFEGTVQAGWTTIMEQLNLDYQIESRVAVSYDEYETIHKGECTIPLSNPGGFILDSVNDEPGNQYGARTYKLM